MLVWRRGFTVLSTGQVLLTKDSRFSLEGKESILVISRIQESDAGEYVCQGTTMTGVQEQHHLLTVAGISIIISS